jgi:hypothetical protein
MSQMMPPGGTLDVRSMEMNVGASKDASTMTGQRQIVQDYRYSKLHGEVANSHQRQRGESPSGKHAFSNTLHQTFGAGIKIQPPGAGMGEQSISLHATTMNNSNQTQANVSATVLSGSQVTNTQGKTSHEYVLNQIQVQPKTA